MNWFSVLLLIAAIYLIVSFFAFILQTAEKKWYFFEYFFFSRVPILLGACLFVIFPFFALGKGNDMLGNLFILRPYQIAIVIFFAYLCAWAIVYSARLLWHSTPVRAELLYQVAENDPVREGKQDFPELPQELLKRPWELVSMALVLPLATMLFLKADGPQISAFVYILAGGTLAYFAQWATHKVVHRVIKKGMMIPQSLKPTQSESATLPPEKTGFGSRVRKFLGAPFVLYNNPDRPRIAAKQKAVWPQRWNQYWEMHVHAVFFMGISFLIYLIGGIFFPPFSSGAIHLQIPALAYLLSLALVLTWLLSFLSFQCDVHRLPIIIVAVMGVLLLRTIWPADHEFRVIQSEKPPAPDIWTVLNQRNAAQHGTIVLVSASGGGITASLWTTTVLRGIGERLDNRFDFHRHVALLSTVSGGSVGGMYYVDSFGTDGHPNMDGAADKSGRTTLAATAWGMAYPDFFRVFLGNRVMGFHDRAWAQEECWRHTLSHPDQTIRDWGKDVQAGLRPLQIFNTTLSETGERMIITPVTINHSAAQLRESIQNSGEKPRTRKNFIETYDGSDLSIVTAARLSATFPYVTPQAKPNVPGRQSFHYADGGYYDNSGILSALDVVDDWLVWQKDMPRPNRIILIEIRASGPSDGKTPNKGGLLASTIGPLATLSHVRTTSQVERNEFEVALAKSRWKQYGVDLEHFVFRLSNTCPLSWHLAEEEKQRIKAHWPYAAAPAKCPSEIQQARADNENQFKALETFLLGETKAPTQTASNDPRSSL